MFARDREKRSRRSSCACAHESFVTTSREFYSSKTIRLSSIGPIQSQWGDKNYTLNRFYFNADFLHENRFIRNLISVIFRTTDHIFKRFQIGFLELTMEIPKSSMAVLVLTWCRVQTCSKFSSSWNIDRPDWKKTDSVRTDFRPVPNSVLTREQLAVTMQTTRRRRVDKPKRYGILCYLTLSLDRTIWPKVYD